MRKQKVLCCCKPNLIHDEALKFQLLFNEPKAINQNNKSSSSTGNPISAEDAYKIEEMIKSKNYSVKDSRNDDILLDNLKDSVEACQIEWSEIKDLAYVNELQIVNYKQFLIAAQNGYSILDTQIFINKCNGRIIEKQSNKDHSNIPRN